MDVGRRLAWQREVLMSGAHESMHYFMTISQLPFAHAPHNACSNWALRHEVRQRELYSALHCTYAAELQVGSAPLFQARPGMSTQHTVLAGLLCAPPTAVPLRASLISLYASNSWKS
mmetsp:Transcript_33838/g.55883  ORF Transcript_33838/g.55883 Transcript_33838/m.55883 type:complete len:117 (-) Transcript_33838:85-435(-)